jgi:NADH:ubiquinone oxidoreductase subunit C
MLKKIETYIPNILYYTINKESFIKISHEYIYSVITILKYHTFFKFTQLIDISAIDYPERQFRFEIFYNLLSMKYNNRITITTTVLENNEVESITNLFPAAN